MKNKETNWDRLSLSQKEELRRIKRLRRYDIKKKNQYCDERYKISDWNIKDFFLYLRDYIGLKSRLKNLMNLYLKGSDEKSNLFFSREKTKVYASSAVCYLESKEFVAWLINAYSYQIIDLDLIKRYSDINENIKDSDRVYLSIFIKILTLNEVIKEDIPKTNTALDSLNQILDAAIEEKCGDRDKAKARLVLIKDVDNIGKIYLERLLKVA